MYYYITSYPRYEAANTPHKSGRISEKYVKILRHFMRSRHVFLLTFIAYEIDDFFNIIDAIWKSKYHFNDNIIESMNSVYRQNQSVANTIKKLHELNYIVSDISPNDVKWIRQHPTKHVAELSDEIKSLNISCVCINISILFGNHDSSKFSLTEDNIKVLQSFFAQTYENYDYSEETVRNANRILNKINVLDIINSRHDEYLTILLE